MKIAALLIFLAILVDPSHAADIADNVVGKAKRACELAPDTEFSVRPDAIIRMDVTGDGAAETLIDSCGFVCKGALSIYGGSAGCPLTIISGDKSWSYFKQAWTTKDWAGKRIIPLWLHGDACGGAGADPCALALVWNGRDFVSVLSKQ